MPATPFTTRLLRLFDCRILCVATVLLGLGTSVRAQMPVMTTATPIDIGRETRNTAKDSPSSALDPQTALIAASTIAGQIRGGIVMSVMPTGSMRPMFDEKAYLVLEPTAFDDLKVGDVITFLHPKLNTPIVHRIFEKHGNSLWTKGDHNDRPDNVYVTPTNYRMRVVAMIFCSRGTGAKVAQTGTAVRAVSMMN